MDKGLTKAQRDLLESLPTTCAASYAPAKKLVALGLARWDTRGLSDVLVPTQQEQKP